jgi:hypothetical protein
MSSGSADEVVRASLQEDPDVERLVQALSLSERFHVYLLICDTPRLTRLVLDVIAARVSEEREQPVHLVELDPYQEHRNAGAPIDATALIDRILGRLVAPELDEQSSDVLFVVNASRALTEDDQAWALLFQRMNERRNVIAKKMNGAILLCLPVRLEPLFAHAAPDFWSIRSTAIRVDRTLPAALEMEAAGLYNLSGVFSETVRGSLEHATGSYRESSDEGLRLRQSVEDARASLAQAPDNEVHSRSLAITLHRLAEHELEKGTVRAALNAAEESVAVARGLIARDPGRAEWLHDLSLHLCEVGDVRQAGGDLERFLGPTGTRTTLEASFGHEGL